MPLPLLSGRKALRGRRVSEHPAPVLSLGLGRGAHGLRHTVLDAPPPTEGTWTPVLVGGVSLSRGSSDLAWHVVSLWQGWSLGGIRQGGVGGVEELSGSWQGGGQS